MRTSKAFWVLLIVSSLAIAVSARAQQFVIGTVDYYGLRSPGAPGKAAVDACLTFTKGDTVEISALRQGPIVNCLTRLPGVSQGHINLVCCTQDNKLMLFVGVSNLEKRSYDSSRYVSKAALSPEVVAAYDTLMNGMLDAIQNGWATEDDSEGHAIFSFPHAKEQQNKFKAYAKNHLAELQHVLRSAHDAKQRVVASWVIAYYPDKTAIVTDLTEAVIDPDSEVRNNALRGLGIVEGYLDQKGVKYPTDPVIFVKMMQSVDWTDRNKSSLVLEKLTRTRDPQLLELLRKEALYPLADMASWQSLGHAYPGFIVLGRMAGWKDEEIGQRAQQDRTKWVEEALSTLNKP